MNVKISVEAELNDECTAVTLTFHAIPLDDLADVLQAIGSPGVVQQYVDSVAAQIPIRRAGGPETRKTICSEVAN